MSDRNTPGKSTLSIWAGEQEHPLYERSTQVPVVHSVSYTYDDLDTWQNVALEKEPGHIYSRNTNPTVRAFEDKVKELEGAEAATSFASGMAAISNVLGTFLKSGDRVVSIKDSYGGTNKIFNDFLPPLNIDVTLCETIDYAQIEAEIAGWEGLGNHGLVGTSANKILKVKIPGHSFGMSQIVKKADELLKLTGG